MNRKRQNYPSSHFTSILRFFHLSEFQNYSSIRYAPDKTEKISSYIEELYIKHCILLALGSHINTHTLEYNQFRFISKLWKENNPSNNNRAAKKSKNQEIFLKNCVSVSGQASIVLSHNKKLRKIVEKAKESKNGTLKVQKSKSSAAIKIRSSNFSYAKKEERRKTQSSICFAIEIRRLEC